MFLDAITLKRCLFVDIETVSDFPDFESMPQEMKDLWVTKCQQLVRGNAGSDPIDFAALYIEKAGIFAEFAKIVCISLGFLHFENGEPTKIRVKSLAGDNEGLILRDFVKILVNHYNDPDSSSICGHNIKEFDIPFICRRLVIHQIKFPPLLDISGKKPWQTTHILDTMDMWRFGDYKNYTSLSLLSSTLGIPSPKDDIDGSMVGPIFWKENDIERIAIYCQKDVVTVIQVMMRYCGQTLFSQEDIEYIQ